MPARVKNPKYKALYSYSLALVLWLSQIHYLSASLHINTIGFHGLRKSLYHVHAHWTPAAIRAANQRLPHSTRGQRSVPSFGDISTLSTIQQRFVFAHLCSTHLTESSSVFSQRSPPWLFTIAACDGLNSPLARPLRETNNPYQWCNTHYLLLTQLSVTTVSNGHGFTLIDGWLGAFILHGPMVSFLSSVVKTKPSALVPLAVLTAPLGEAIWRPFRLKLLSCMTLLFPANAKIKIEGFPQFI